MSDWIDISAFDEAGDLKKELGFYGWVGEMRFLLHVCLSVLAWLIQVETCDSGGFIREGQGTYLDGDTDF